jgi:hypothetical protein
MTLYDYKIRVKPVTTPPKTPNTPQGRDTFQTPNYAVELLIPFIPKTVRRIWECACGDGKISLYLEKKGFEVWSTDIRQNEDIVDSVFNFVTQTANCMEDCILSNPPFSLKEDFIEKAFSYGKPFAFLINADYSQQTISWIKRGCQKVVPTSRIAYITPNILNRIHNGEVFKVAKEKYSIPFKNVDDFVSHDPKSWESFLAEFSGVHNYNNIKEVPQEFLYKYSSAQFHSMWLTHGFDLGSSEIFVDLPIKERKFNI